MSIPPLLSRSPPPICETSDEDDDAFGAFVVGNELAVDVSQGFLEVKILGRNMKVKGFPTDGGDILEDYEKKAAGNRCEDTTSDDSGLCMGSVGQNQSPCDTSPVSSTYIQTSATDTENNCDKSNFSFPTLDPEDFEENFHSNSLTHSVGDKESCSSQTVICESEDSEVNFEELKTGLLYESPCLSLTKVDSSITFKDIVQPAETNESCDVDNNVEVDEDTQNIPFDEFNADVCDQDSYIAKVDRLVESESIDFDDFQTFESSSNKCERFNEEEQSSTEVLESANETNTQVKSLPNGHKNASTTIDINNSCSDGISSIPEGTELSPGVTFKVLHHQKQNEIEDEIGSNGLAYVSTSDIIKHEDTPDVDDYSELDDNACSYLDANACSQFDIDACSQFDIGACSQFDVSTCVQLHSIDTPQIKLGTGRSSSSDDDDDDDDDDDEFSDFADFQSSTEIVDFSKNSKIPTENLEQESWIHWWPECISSPIFALHLNDELKGSKIWTELKQLDSSPALLYQWSSSVSNCKLLSALNIDSRNILLGPWNRYKFSTTDGFSSDLMKKTLVRDKPESMDESGTVKDPVPDAHFDWVGSGLVNPLDCVSTTLLDLQLLTFARAPTDKALPATLLLSPHDRRRHNDPKETYYTSKIANEILQTLPDLSFMKKSFIVFPKCAT